MHVLFLEQALYMMQVLKSNRMSDCSVWMPVTDYAGP